MISNRPIRVFLVLAASTGLAALAAQPALGEINGPCSASIAGQGVRDRGTSATSDAIEVSRHSSVPVSMSAKSEISHLKIQIEFAGIRWTVRDKPSHGTSWANSVPADKYAKYGVGLYKVVGSSSGSGLSCSGAALVRVKGNPLSTVAGLAGLAATLLGLAGMIGSFVLALRRGRMRIGGSILALVSGLVGALGLGTLLQQYALLYPTRTAAVALLVGGPVAGLVLSTLGRVLGVRRPGVAS